MISLSDAVIVLEVTFDRVLDQGAALCWHFLSPTQKQSTNSSKFTKHSWHYLSLCSLSFTQRRSDPLCACLGFEVEGKECVWFPLWCGGGGWNHCVSRWMFEQVRGMRPCCGHWGIKAGCFLGGATGPALEKDPHSTSLSSSSHT